MTCHSLACWQNDMPFSRPAAAAAAARAAAPDSAGVRKDMSDMSDMCICQEDFNNGMRSYRCIRYRHPYGDPYGASECWSSGQYFRLPNGACTCQMSSNQEAALPCPSNTNSPPNSIAFSQAMTTPYRPTTVPVYYSCNAADGPFMTTNPCDRNGALSFCTACLAGFPKYKEMTISALNRTDEMTCTLQFSSIQFNEAASLPVIIGAVVGGISVLLFEV